MFAPLRRASVSNGQVIARRHSSSSPSGRLPPGDSPHRVLRGLLAVHPNTVQPHARGVAQALRRDRGGAAGSVVVHATLAALTSVAGPPMVRYPRDEGGSWRNSSRSRARPTSLRRGEVRRGGGEEDRPLQPGGNLL